MKKILIAILVLCLGVSIMAANAKKSKVTKVATPDKTWSVIDIGFWYGFPASIEENNIRGLRLGWPISAGKGYVEGNEAAFFCADTDNIKGLQLSFGLSRTKNLIGWQVAPVNICDKIEGPQIGIVNIAGKRAWQFGLVNSGDNAKFQLGLLNLNKGGFLPWTILINFGKDTFRSAESIRAENPAYKK